MVHIRLLVYIMFHTHTSVNIIFICIFHMSIVSLLYCHSPSYVHCVSGLLSLTFICPSALWFIVILLLFVLFVYLFLHVSTMYSVHMVIPPMYSRWGCGPPCTGTSPMAPHGRAFPFGVHRVVTSAGPQSQPDTERESHTAIPVSFYCAYLKKAAFMAETSCTNKYIY